MHRFAMPDLGVDGHDPKVLATHLEYLRRRDYRLMSLAELLRHLDEGVPLEQNALIFTVDDGYADFADVAAPVFAAYDCPVTVFVVTDFVSGRLWNWFDRVEWAFASSEHRESATDILQERVHHRWTTSAECRRASDDVVERLKRVDDVVKEETIRDLEEALGVRIPQSTPERYRAMTWDQVRACARRGVTFGPHTVTHPILSQVSAPRADFEISESWRAVAEATDGAVPVFCYPNGTPKDFSARDKESVARAGMTAALSTIDGSLESSASGIEAADRFELPRFAYAEERPRFVQIASGLEERKVRLRRLLSP